MRVQNSTDQTRSLARLVSGILMGLMLIFIPGYAAFAEEPQFSEEVEACLSCHSDSSLEMELADGPISVYVDPEEFANSVHGQNLNCNDCHSGITEYPHPEVQYKNRRDINLASYENCKKCHFDNYTKTLEGIHYNLLSKGDQRAPTCVDCHGAHNIKPPDRPKSHVSQTCKSCHEDVYDTYVKSVHGKALVNGENSDAPVCTDCHQAHDIEDPRTKSFLLKTPQLCGQCHSDEKLMKKYGISTHVVETYLSDFHGVSATFYKDSAENINSWKAVCTDCHGVHDISAVSDEKSPVLKANVVNTCRKCHPSATPDFPDAWLSHYEPSPDKAASVYYVKLFYKFFIPFTIAGLVLHILLHLWRIAVNR